MRGCGTTHAQIHLLSRDTKSTKVRTIQLRARFCLRPGEGELQNYSDTSQWLEFGSKMLWRELQVMITHYSRQTSWSTGFMKYTTFVLVPKMTAKVKVDENKPIIGIYPNEVVTQ